MCAVNLTDHWRQILLNAKTRERCKADLRSLIKKYHETLDGVSKRHASEETVRTWRPKENLV